MRRLTVGVALVCLLVLTTSGTLGFTDVDASRPANVDVVGDDEAYLYLNQETTEETTGVISDETTLVTVGNHLTQQTTVTAGITSVRSSDGTTLDQSVLEAKFDVSGSPELDPGETAHLSVTCSRPQVDRRVSLRVSATGSAVDASADRALSVSCVPPLSVYKELASFNGCGHARLKPSDERFPVEVQPIVGEERGDVQTVFANEKIGKGGLEGKLTGLYFPAYDGIVEEPRVENPNTCKASGSQGRGQNDG